ncbi:MAG: hypothetical protein K0Q74_257 [Gammaproteobacteria bacterium]|jgi:hypothetical protein|nr:hypothetical protein [Gammaproteobacteria bacterium]
MGLDTPYKSHQAIWETHSSVRKKPRAIVFEEDCYYPIQKQPLCIHPFMQKLGDQAVNYVLIQSAYRFMFNIARIETDIINVAATKIANNALHVKFPDEMCLDAYTIIVDEAYHAYVAFDFILQMKTVTGIMPLVDENEKSALCCAINHIAPTLEGKLKESFELIAVCMAENSITHELAALMKMENINKAFEAVTSDHLRDEGRHSSYFAKILKYYWAQLDDAIKDKLVFILPIFLEKYIASDDEEKFSNKILQSLFLSDADINQILMDTYFPYGEGNLFQVSPVAKNVLALFEKCHLLDHPGMREVFSRS